MDNRNEEKTPVRYRNDSSRKSKARSEDMRYGPEVPEKVYIIRNYWSSPSIEDNSIILIFFIVWKQH